MKRSKFSLSHYKLTTLYMGQLIPLTWLEVLPGDSMQQATSALVRATPLVAPIMHPVIVKIHHWFVPYRLIWEDFEDFITGGPDGTSTPTHPYVTLDADYNEISLEHYLGVPDYTYAVKNRDISALPFRAYNLIWNDNYRDQDLSTENTIDITSGQDTTTDRDIMNVCWDKDYFTTARPWEQKGDEITIPLGDTAPIIGLGSSNQTYNQTSVSAYETDGTGASTYADASYYSDSNLIWEEDPSNAGFPNIRADLTAATGVNISDLRLALALQRYQEARAQYGSRYVEYLRYLGVRSSDARLQSPEYLGGGRQTVQFSEVLNHSATTGNLGDLAGHGIAAMKTNRYRRFFEEHGLIMTTMSIVPKAIYQDGFHRSLIRTTKEDYFQKELQFIGQQEVYNKEVRSVHSTPDGVFGYQNRYDEYRSHPSGVSGEFLTTQENWHMARQFASDPSLNETFVKATPTQRCFADTSNTPFYVMANHSIQARRPLAKVARAKTF